jgi:hypothetical protein
MFSYVKLQQGAPAAVGVVKFVMCLLSLPFISYMDRKISVGLFQFLLDLNNLLPKPLLFLPSLFYFFIFKSIYQ